MDALELALNPQCPKMMFNFYAGKNEFLIDLNEVKGIMTGIGLILRTSSTKPLLFTFDKPNRTAITSMFVFFPFLAVWLDENRKVTEIIKVDPFTLSIKPKQNSKYLVEIPINEISQNMAGKLLRL